MKNGCTAVIVAAGTAQRMRGIDKMMTPLSGTPLLLRTVRALAASESITHIGIVARDDLVSLVAALCAEEPKLAFVVPGGSTRAESVLKGLENVKTALVAIHDGARPLVTADIIDEAITAAGESGAAAPAIPVHDTIKIAANGFVETTPERSTLFAVQTPQVFFTAQITQALQAAIARGIALTDDCSAMEAAG